MPIIVKEKTALQVNQLAKKNGRHNVGGCQGLYLQVNDKAASWLLMIKVDGKRRELGLGSFQAVTLAQARSKGREYREKIANGENPVGARQKFPLIEIKRERKKTFEEFAKEVHRRLSTGFTNPKHSAQWINSLTTYAFPIIGSRAIDELTSDDFRQVLDPIWHRIHETATRVAQRMEQVMERAKVEKLYFGENSARMRGNLEYMLDCVAYEAEPRPALPWQDMPIFWAELKKQTGMRAWALQFLILNWCRTGEVRLMEWPEVNLQERIWTAPKEHMKMKREHQMPLARQSIELLESLPRISESKLVFPGNNSNRPMCANNMLQLLQRMIGKEAVTHGMRSSAMDWARNQTHYPLEVRELQLAHKQKDKTIQAYSRDSLVNKRRQMIQDWADYLDGTFMSPIPHDVDLAWIESPLTSAIRRAPTSIAASEIPTLVAELQRIQTTQARALLFTILTWANVAEVTTLRWPHLDIERGIWTIPQSLSSCGFELKIPLTPQAIALLKLQTANPRHPVFRDHAGEAVSIRSLDLLCTNLRGKAVIPRSVRHAAAKWALGNQQYELEAIEQQLGHVPDVDGSKWKERKKILIDWARFATLETAKAAI
jgi:integrase